MTEPEAGPVAATKEGSDCDNPANSPLLFSFSSSSWSYTIAEIYSHCAFPLRDVENNSLLQSSTIYILPEMLDECLTKHHFIPQPQLFDIFFPFMLTRSIILIFLKYIFRVWRQQVLLVAISGCLWSSHSLSGHKVKTKMWKNMFSLITGTTLLLQINLVCKV